MKRFVVLSLSCLLCWPSRAASETIAPVRLQSIELNGFWKQQAKQQTEQWLPHCVAQMEKGGRG